MIDFKIIRRTGLFKIRRSINKLVRKFMAKEIIKGSDVRNKKTRATRMIVSVTKNSKGFSYSWKSGKKSGKCSKPTLMRWISGKDN